MNWLLFVTVAIAVLALLNGLGWLYEARRQRKLVARLLAQRDVALAHNTETEHAYALLESAHDQALRQLQAAQKELAALKTSAVALSPRPARKVAKEAKEP